MRIALSCACNFAPLSPSLGQEAIPCCVQTVSLGKLRSPTVDGKERMSRFLLSPSRATLVLQRGDLTRWQGDAVVNAANSRMLGGGGVDGALHAAAGPQLREVCEKVECVRPGVRCPPGEARITPAFNLPCKYVIHTVGPIFENLQTDGPTLESCYRSCLKLANEYGVKTIAFPAVSCGIYGFPMQDAATVALKACAENAQSMQEIHFVLFNDEAYHAWLQEAERTLNFVGDETKE